MSLKSKLWKNGDWLCVTLEVPADAGSMIDVASDFDDFDSALKHMEHVRTDEGTKMLLDHARQHAVSVAQIATLQRTKASEILRLSALAVTLLTLFVGIVASKLTVVGWWVVIPVIPLVLSVLHLVRAFFKSLEILRTEVYFEPSPHDVVRVLSDWDVSRSRRRLAAHIVAASNKSHARLLDRVDAVVISVESLRWAFSSMLLASVLLAITFVLAGQITVPGGDHANAVRHRGPAISQHASQADANNSRDSGTTGLMIFLDSDAGDLHPDVGPSTRDDEIHDASPTSTDVGRPPQEH